MKTMAETGEWFKPEKLVALYNAYLAIVFAVFFLPPTAGAFLAWVLAEASPVIPVAASAVMLLLLGFVGWWIRAFYETSFYRLTEDDIEHRRGVWFKSTTEVPYNRITNVGTHQDPVQRYVGSGQVKIQTAGSSAQTGAELTITGIGNFEEIQQAVVDRVKAKKASTAVESFEEEDHAKGDVNRQILEEIRQIRTLLEQG